MRVGTARGDDSSIGRNTGWACLALLLFGIPPLDARAQAPQPVPVPQMTPEQLESLVAPIALYPDPLLSQVLVACTYPLEIVEAQPITPGCEIDFTGSGVQVNADGSSLYFITVTNVGNKAAQFHFRGCVIC